MQRVWATVLFSGSFGCVKPLINDFFKLPVSYNLCLLNMYIASISVTFCCKDIAVCGGGHSGRHLQFLI